MRRFWHRICGWFTGERWARETIREFRERFPGACAVCSFARYCRMHGLDDKPPREHACPEVA